MAATGSYAYACTVNDGTTVLPVGVGVDNYHQPELKLVRPDHRTQGHSVYPCTGEYP